MGIESNSHDFALMAHKSVQKVASLSVPQFGSFIKGACRYFVAK